MMTLNHMACKMRCAIIAAIIMLPLYFSVTGAAAAQGGPVINNNLGGTTIVGQRGGAGEVLAEPLCSFVLNRAPYTLHGSVATDYFTMPDGEKAHHRSNFRLETGERAEFCTSGPFHEGRRVELVLRSLVPLFSCKTAFSEGIILHGQLLPEGGTRSWADCY